MARSRYVCCKVLALALVLSAVEVAQAQAPSRQRTALSKQEGKTSDGGIVRKVFSLRDLGNDPELGKWIAQTIPSLIQPGQWDAGGAGSMPLPGKGKLVYNAAARLLVVQHNAAVQREVEAFLKEVKQALPGLHSAATMTAARDVNALLPLGSSTTVRGNHLQVGLSGANAPVPAGYSNPALLKPGAKAPEKSSYLIPAPEKQPKHLFHLIIRYEGDGVIDANIANVLQSLSGQAEDDGAKSQPSKDAEKTPCPQAGKTPAPSQLFNFILRYEGEGIIDSTVAAMFKDMYRQMSGPAGYPAPASVPAEALPYSATVTPGPMNNPGFPVAPPAAISNLAVPNGAPTPVNGEIKLVGGKGQVESELAAADPSDRLQQQSKCKVFTVALKAGRTYEIEMIRKNGKGIQRFGQFDPFLRLENSAGTQLMVDDDSAGNLNARIVFRCPQDGTFRVVATSLHGAGHFTLKVRESSGTPVPAGATPPPYTAQ